MVKEYVCGVPVRKSRKIRGRCQLSSLALDCVIAVIGSPQLVSHIIYDGEKHVDRIARAKPLHCDKDFIPKITSEPKRNKRTNREQDGNQGASVGTANPPFGIRFLR